MASWGGALKKVASEGGGGGSESGGSESGADDRGSNYSSGNSSNTFEYFGWVYHLGVNSIGHEYCHLRYLCIRGKYVEMYKRDPRENPGVVSPHILNHLRFFVYLFIYFFEVLYGLCLVREDD